MDLVYDAEERLFGCEADFTGLGWYDMIISARDNNGNTANETIHIYFYVHLY
ncbi:MAG: hypothetical protein KGY65_08670 [Candidatus Thermoplasmatota archaeon]|nr:hypothetical protein [Candidatus Thermoplasmatota archaeon]